MFKLFKILLCRQKITDIFDAAKKGDTKYLQQIAAGVDINSTDGLHRTPLLLACSNQHPDTALQLIIEGADVNIISQGRWTPLMSAAQHGYLDVLTLLLDKGASMEVLTDGGHTAISIALLFGQNECAHELIERGADVHSTFDFMGYTTLMFAIAHCDLSTGKRLLEKGVEVNRITFDGMTALKLAELRGQPELVDLLKQAGGNE